MINDRVSFIELALPKVSDTDCPCATEWRVVAGSFPILRSQHVNDSAQVGNTCD